MLSLLLAYLTRIYRAVLSLLSSSSALLSQLAILQRQQVEILQDLALISDLLLSGQAERLVFIADLEGQLSYGVTKMTLRDDQQVTLTIQPVDKKGKPALVDGVPLWASSAPTVVDLVVAADGMSATAIGGTPSATPADVTVTADADLGSGVLTISGTLSITVVSGAATSVTIVPSTPVDQTPPPPPVVP